MSHSVPLVAVVQGCISERPLGALNDEIDALTVQLPTPTNSPLATYWPSRALTLPAHRSPPPAPLGQGSEVAFALLCGAPGRLQAFRRRPPGQGSRYGDAPT